MSLRLFGLASEIDAHRCLDMAPAWGHVPAVGARKVAVTREYRSKSPSLVRPQDALSQSGDILRCKIWHLIRLCRECAALTMLHDYLTTPDRSNAGFLKFKDR